MYADYDQGCEVRNRRFDTVFRALLVQSREAKQTQIETPLSTLLLYSSLIETIFYLPNRFRQTVMLNTHNVAFTTSESALLSLMSIMFNL